MTLISTLRKYLLFALLLLAATLVKATHYYVDSSATTGANNGLSWANAFRTPQPAINFALAGDTLWIADGHYYTGLSGDNGSYIYLKNGVTLLCGFQGLSGAQETNAAQRNFLLNKTYFSGDLDKNGVHSTADAYHVVWTAGNDTTAVVDGLIIEFGNADGPGLGTLAGGIMGYNGGGTFRNCVVQKNYCSGFGAGAYTIGHFNFMQCIFRDNVSGSVGGGLCQAGNTFKVRIHNCVFLDNIAPSYAGAIYSESPFCQIFNCTFKGNTSNSMGSALFLNNAGVSVQNSILWDNPANDIAGSAIVNRCIVEGGFAGGTNILNVNPAFLDAMGRIGSCSPAADAGDTILVIAKDFDGNPRPFDADGNLVAKWDLGAFEAQTPRSFPSANPIVGQNPACANSFNNLYRVTTDNSPTNTYKWTLASGGTIAGTSTNDSVRINWGSTLGTYVLVVQETNAANGCSTTNSTSVVLSAPPTVTINPAPRDSICTGDSVLVTLVGAGVSQQWYRNGLAISGATGATIRAKLAGNYNAIKVGANGCGDSAAVALKLYLRPLPVVNLTTSVPVPICQGTTVTITGSSGTAHQWYRNGITQVGATTNTFATSVAGVYNMRKTDGFGCRDSAATGLNLIVNPLPIVTVNPHATDTICIGDSLALTAIAANPVSYQWFRNQVPISSSNVNPFQAKLSGYYNCRLTNNNGCTDSASVGERLISNDFVNPVALCRNLTIHLNGAGSATLTPPMVDNGSSDNCRIATFALSTSNFTCAQLGTNPVTLTITDLAGRTSTCASIVTVRDTLKPNVVCSPATVYLAGNGQLVLNPAIVGGASTDNCGITLATVSPSNFVCADTGAHPVTYTAQDASGNVRTCTTTIILEDSTRPNALCRSVTIFLNGLGNASTTVAAVNNSSSDNCGIASIGLSRSNFTCADVPGVFVSLSMQDVSGNMSSCSSYVRVVDSVAPVPHCRDTVIFINFTGIANLTPANLNNNSTDNCSVDSLWISQSSFTCANTGLNNVTLSVADADTNIRTCISQVTIQDTIAPQAVCTDTTFYLNPFGIATVNPAVFGINSVDNCTYFDTAYVNVGTFNCGQTGFHPVMLYVVDVSGRIDSCAGTVRILDNLAPLAQCNNIAPILSPGGTVSITVGQVNNASTDNCSITSLALSKTSFTCADVGPNNIVLSVTDIFGNVGTCTSVVTVTDTAAPVPICQSVTTYLNGSGNASITAVQVNNGSTDNCGIASMVVAPSNFTCAQAGNNSVILTVTDGFGNARICSANATVLDTIRPVAICQNLTAYLNPSGQFTLTPAMVDNGSTDNCAISTRILSQTSFACAQIGSNTVTLTLTDPSGGTRTCTSTVMVVDSLDPIAICSNGTFYLNAAGNLTLTVGDIASASSDNCSISSSGLSMSAFTCANLGANTVTANFSDASGNTSSCTATVTIADTIRPTMVCLNSSVVLNGSGNATITVGDVNGGNADACGITATTLSMSSFACTNVGLNLVTMTATDGSGNSGTCVANVTVLDTIRPVIACTTATVSLDANGNYTLMGSLLASGSTDVCGIDTAYAVPALFSCADIGNNTVQVFVEDPFGNLDSCTTTFILRDNLAPVADCDSVLLQLGSNGLATLTPAILGPNSSDNCGIDSSTVSQSVFSCANTGWIAVTLTLWDSTGNQSSCLGHAMVVDTSGIAAPSLNLGADTTACNGDVLLLDAGAGMSSYVWSNGDTTQSISVATAGLYWVQVVSPQGCIGRDSLILSSFVTPNPNLRTESGNDVVCLYDTLRLLVNPIFSSYVWSTGSTLSYTDVQTGGNYSVIVTDNNGCELLQTIAVSFAPFPGPNPQINPSGNVGMCENTTIQLDAGAGYYVYRWNTNQTTQTITAFVPGAYSVQVWNGFGCHATSPVVTVTQLPSPYPDINRLGDTLFTNTIGSAYQWYLGSVPILGATGRQYIAAMNGDYSVRVYYASGCTEISSSITFIVGIADALQLLNGVDVYPNPSDGNISLRPSSPIRKSIELRVTDMYGKQLNKESLRNLNAEQKLNLQNLPVGMYLLELKTADARIVRRIVIE